MRVFVNRRPREERGATAVIVGLLAIALFMLSAFTIDFGIAFNSKRELQNSADAGALAAASVYANNSNGGACDISFINTHASEAEAQAHKYRDDNTSSMDYGEDPSDVSFTPTCDEGTIRVEYWVQRATDTFFGRLMGVDEVSTSRGAVAVVEVPTSTSGLRPIALCSALIPGGSLPSAVVKVGGPPTQSHQSPPEGCPNAANPGNWWSLKCPEETNNGGLPDKIRNGCSDEVTIVPDQPTDPATLGEYLLSQCPTASSSCLLANPGAFATQVANAFSYLIHNEVPVVLPVFCGDPQCNPKGASEDPGTNTVYPVYRLTGATICGYRFNNIIDEVDYKDEEYQGICRARNINDVTVENAGEKGENYLLLVFHTIQVSGGTKPTTCKIGDPCDGGLRRVRLVE